MPECVFCKIIKGELPSSKVYEDDDVLAFLDIAPVNKGHVLVVPKEHYQDLLAAPDQVLQKMVVVAKKVGQAIEKALNVKGFNIGVNNGTVAGQLVPHLHFHVIPRYAYDKLSPWPHGKYEEGKASAVAEKIKKEIFII